MFGLTIDDDGHDASGDGKGIAVETYNIKLDFGISKVNALVKAAVPMAVAVAYGIAVWVGVLDVCTYLSEVIWTARSSSQRQSTTTTTTTTNDANDANDANVDADGSDRKDKARQSKISPKVAGGIGKKTKEDPEKKKKNKKKVAREDDDAESPTKETRKSTQAPTNVWPASLFFAIKLAFTSAAGCSMILVSSIPLSQQLRTGLPDLYGVGYAHELNAKLAPYHVASGYGLFRRMTGVGLDGAVARPEVVVEGSQDGNEWYEIDFKHKPGNVATMPTLVAPHQPRLDWQMWFAALQGAGGGARVPWFLHLLHKLHVGSPAVLDLLAPAPAEQQKPKYLRAKLYEYDFTRLDTSWARGNRKVKAVPLLILPSGEHPFQNVVAHWKTYVAAPAPGKENAAAVPWWHRRSPDVFIGVIEANHKGLGEFLQERGWDPGYRAPEPVDDGSFGCTAKGASLMPVCVVLEAARAAGVRTLVLTAFAIMMIPSFL